MNAANMSGKKQLKILILEDSSSDTELMLMKLSKAKIKFISKQIDNKEDFLKSLKEFKPDIVLLDYLLPKFDGMSALLLMRKLYPEIPSIVVTGSINEETAVECMKAGADDYVLKDHLVRLLPAINGAIRKKEDIEAKKRSEQDKEKLQTQILQLQKMKAIGTLTGGIAHDFNNILCGIKGFADLLLMDIKKGHAIYDDLEKIRSIAVYGSSLVNQLLIFTQQRPTEFKILSLNIVINDIVKMLKRLIGEDIEINIELARELWQVKADEANLKQIIVNLAINARDAMHDGGILTITTENMNLDEDKCRMITELYPGKFVCLSVSDTGIGMDKYTVQRVFEPFFTSKEIGKGTGLGLSVVYGIVKQHGGTISVNSKSGEGTTIKVYLPSSPEKTKNEINGNKISLKETKSSGIRILMIEDEDAVRKVAKRILARNGYFVYEAANAGEAMDIFEQENGNFNIVFSDVILPDINGIKLVEKLKTCKPELRILLTSGYIDNKVDRESIYKRGYNYIQKPYGVKDLLQKIKAALNSN